MGGVSSFVLSFWGPLLSAEDVGHNIPERLLSRFKGDGFGYEEKRNYYVVTIERRGKKRVNFGPLLCSDFVVIYSGFACGPVRPGVGDSLWYDLEGQRVVVIKNGVWKRRRKLFDVSFRLKILLNEKVAVVSLEGEEVGTVNVDLHSGFGFLAKKYGRSLREVPARYRCSTDGPVVFEVLENNVELKELEVKNDFVLMGMFGDRGYPYVFRYVDDDDSYFGGVSKFGTGRCIYVFVGADGLRVVSRVPDMFCMFHHWLDKTIRFKDVRD